MSIPPKAWATGDYLVALVAAMAIVAGLILVVDHSYQTSVIQLRPANHIARLPKWGVVMVVAGAVAASWRVHVRVAVWGLLVVALETTFLAICNLGEATYLAHHPGEQLGWLGALLWIFVAVVAGIAYVSQQTGRR